MSGGAIAPPRFVRAVKGFELLEVARRSPNLSTVSAIDITFCPWLNNSFSTKAFWEKVNGELSRRTNRVCPIRTTCLHDNSEPKILVQFSDGEKLCLHGANLTSDELMYHFNAFCINKELSAADTPQALF